MLTRISDNLLKLEHHAGGADELRQIATTNIAKMLNKKSELNLKEKEVFPQVCIDAF